jgi:ABC-type transporter Mla subunit MlaD
MLRRSNAATPTRRITAALASSRALFLTAVLAGSLTGLGFLGIGASSHTVTARVSDADGLVVGNEVRVAGVQAGTVGAVHIAVDPSSGQQYAEVQFQVDSTHWPLHQGTSVAVKPKGVLSNVFVALMPGADTGPSLGNNPFFDVNQTQSPVNLDELSNVFNSDVTHSIRTQLQEGVLALGGAGATDLNQTISYANPLTRDVIPVTDVLAQRSPQLDLLNFEFDTISGDLAREDSNLRPLVVNLDTTLAALAAREVELQGTLVHASHVFGDLDQALSSQTTQTDLQYIFKFGPSALTCSIALSSYITPLVHSVNPYISTLDALLGEFVTATGYNAYSSPSGSPVVDTLRIDPTLPPSSGYTATESGGLGAEHPPQYVVPDPSSLPLPTKGLPNGCLESPPK